MKLARATTKPGSLSLPLFHRQPTQAGVIVRFGSAIILDARGAEIMASELNATADASATREISREELRRRLHDSSLTIVDVLPEASYVGAHIPGALSLPLEQIASRAHELLPDPAAELAVYCGKFT
ncbi:MAG: rhodanese-like domain-containing protein [Candidatus Binatus sp.]